MTMNNFINNTKSKLFNGKIVKNKINFKSSNKKSKNNKCKMLNSKK